MKKVCVLWEKMKTPLLFSERVVYGDSGGVGGSSGWPFLAAFERANVRCECGCSYILGRKKEGGSFEPSVLLYCIILLLSI